MACSGMFIWASVHSETNMKLETKRHPQLRRNKPKLKRKIRIRVLCFMQLKKLDLYLQM